MVKTNISLADQLKRVSQMVERVVDNRGCVNAIERAILLNALQEMYEDVLRLPLAERKETIVLQHHEADLGTKHIGSHQVREYDELVKEVSLGSMPPTRSFVDDGSPAAEEIKPQFAVVPEEETPVFSQPSMEEVEGSSNDELFEDTGFDDVNALKEAETHKKAEEEIIRRKTEEEQARGKAEEEQARRKTAEKEEVHVAITSKVKDNKGQKDNAEPSLFDLLNKSRATEGSAVSAEATRKTLGEKLTHPVSSVEDEVESKMKKQRVGDLRTLININDKFSFMSELFHNNMKAYNDFILRLNATDERAQALKYVNEMAQQYHWDNESLSVKTFYSIFDRKF